MPKCPRCKQVIRDGSVYTPSEFAAMAPPVGPKPADPDDERLAELIAQRDQAQAAWQAALQAREAMEKQHERYATVLQRVIAGYGTGVSWERLQALTKDERERELKARAELMAVLELEAERRGALNAINLQIDARRAELRRAASVAAYEAQRPKSGAEAVRDDLMARMMGLKPAGEPLPQPQAEGA